MDISPRPEEKKQQKKGLRFSEGVVERATDKENVDSLANAFGAALFEEEAEMNEHPQERVGYLAIQQPLGHQRCFLRRLERDVGFRDAVDSVLVDESHSVVRLLGDEAGERHTALQLHDHGLCS